MLADSQYAKDAFDKGLPYKEYLATGTPDQQARWQQMNDKISLNDEQKALLASFVREMKILVVSGVWCGDCVEQCPLIATIAQASDKIDLRFIDRDTLPDLRDQITICAGTRVPVAIFMAEDYALCSIYGDRTLNRYRKLAEKQLGAACSTGLFTPETDEVNMTLSDWLGEVERIQIMLRLSTRLRDKHGD